MDIAIIVSTADTGGMNIKQALLRLFDFKNTGDLFEGNAVFELNQPEEAPTHSAPANHSDLISLNENKIKLYSVNKESILCENIDKEINADLFVFATKHQSKSGIKTLSCHAPGNWGIAEAGGRDNRLCIAPADYLKTFFLKLNEIAAEFAEKHGYDIVMECTHHGPFLDTPVMFVEIGSTIKEWRSKEAGEIIAKTLINVFSRTPAHSTPSSAKEKTESLTRVAPPSFHKPKRNLNYKAAVGIGGQHTCSNFKKIQLGEDIAIGHICPKYNLASLDKHMLLQAIKRTEPKAELIILDWKGLGSEKERIKQIAEELAAEMSLEIKRTGDFS